jgi:hypothetical protein
MIVLGIKRFGPQVVAFRNDFCLTCNGPRMSVLVRSFEAMHLYWIPIVPLFWRKRWTCSECGADPHARVASGSLTLVAFALLLLVLGAAAWSMPVDPADPALSWGMRVLPPLGALGVVGWLVVRPRPAELKEALRVVQASTLEACIDCERSLLFSPVPHCPHCGIQRLELGQQHRPLPSEFRLPG